MRDLRRTGRLRRLLRADAPSADPDLARALEPLSADDRAIVERALPHTMTGVARLQANLDAVRYCVRRGIPGAIAECGVWRGGSMLAMAMALQQMGAADRELHLYDTFEGMTEPSEHDTSPVDDPALETWRRAQARNETAWPEVFGPDAFDEAGVRELVLSTGYEPGLVNVVRGRVEDTLPARAPGAIAVLRLDTDWYESTRHELEHLYPRLSPGGVLIVDDYGHWDGARRAVDEHMAKHGALLLGRVDYSCRMAIKH